jgi:hypothetical protein
MPAAPRGAAARSEPPASADRRLIACKAPLPMRYYAAFGVAVSLGPMGSNSNNNTTLQDLATLAGVSVSTVSRALNDHPLISTRTKQRVWALARDHDYPFKPTMPSGPIGAEWDRSRSSRR